MSPWDSQSRIPVTDIDNRYRMGNLNFSSKSRGLISSPLIHGSYIASTHSTFITFTSVLIFATYLYFGVVMSPQTRWVTSEVRSRTCFAPMSCAFLDRACLSIVSLNLVNNTEFQVKDRSHETRGGPRYSISQFYSTGENGV